MVTTILMSSKHFTFVHFPTIKTQLALSKVARSVQSFLQQIHRVYYVSITTQSDKTLNKAQSWGEKYLVTLWWGSITSEICTGHHGCTLHSQVFELGICRKLQVNYCHKTYREDVGGRVTNVKGGEDMKANITWQRGWDFRKHLLTEHSIKKLYQCL